MRNFIVVPVFNKQNGVFVTFENDVTIHRSVSTTKHPASIIRLSVVASDGEKMPAASCEGGYRLTSAVQK